MIVGATALCSRSTTHSLVAIPDTARTTWCDGHWHHPCEPVVVELVALRTTALGETHLSTPPRKILLSLQLDGGAEKRRCAGRWGTRTISRERGAQAYG